MPTEARADASPIGLGINYHFLREAGSGSFPLRNHELPARFAHQLEQLSKRFRFVRCEELVDASVAERDGDPVVAITFDDGAKDVFVDALPILQRVGATATAFVCSRPYTHGRLLQVQQVEFLMTRLGVERFRRAFYAEFERQCPEDVEREPLDFAGDYRFYRYDDEPIRSFKLDLNYQLPYAVVEPVLDALFAQTFGSGAEADAVRATYMSLDELKRLADAGIEIGTHTHTHRVLPRLDFIDQKNEMETSVAFLKEVTGRSRIPVAYPFGFHDDETLQAAAELELSGGFAMKRRWIEPADLAQRWAVPRFDVNDCFDRRTNELLEVAPPRP